MTLNGNKSLNDPEGDSAFSRRTLLQASAGLGTALVAGAAAHVWDRTQGLTSGGADGSRATGAGAPVPGEAVGPAREIGHRLRAQSAPESSHANTHEDDASIYDVIVVGAGIAGLGAAWHLKKAGLENFIVLDLESDVGGNARAGRNAHGAFPWGAHYVPLPNSESADVRALFRDLGILRGTDARGEDIFDELALCHAPQERLFQNGRWHEGLWPAAGARAQDEAELARFLEIVKGYQMRRDAQGRKAFAIPLDQSARDADLMRLDTISMRAWLHEQGLRSERLAWFVEYGCRDDYGTGLDTTSAWAGLHYFAARERTKDHTVLTWPAGNGHIVQGLRERLAAHLRTGTLVERIQATGTGRTDAGALVRIRAFSPPDGGRNGRSAPARAAPGTPGTLRARRVVAAIPQFVLPYIVDGFPTHRIESCGRFSYAPWLVANITVRGPAGSRASDLLGGGRGFPLCWDNVIHAGAGLGYVVAGHQDLDRKPLGAPANITYYRCFERDDPKTVRARMQSAPAEVWKEMAIADLEIAHPGMRTHLASCDVMLWAHAMVRPTPGFLWNAPARREAAQPWRTLHFGHSDLGGVSIFEEALGHGVRAAREALASLGSFASVPD